MDTSGENVLNAQSCGTQLCIIPARLTKRVTELACYLVNNGSIAQELKLDSKFKNRRKIIIL